MLYNLQRYGHFLSMTLMSSLETSYYCRIVNLVMTPTQWIQNLQYDIMVNHGASFYQNGHKAPSSFI